MAERFIIKRLDRMDWRLIMDPLVEFMLLEPLCTSLSLHRDRDREAIGRFFQPLLEASTTAFLLAAWDTQLDQVAGFLHASIPAEAAPPSWKGCGFSDDVIAIGQSLSAFLGKLLAFNVAEKLGTDELLYFNLSAVCPQYQGQGLAKRLRQRCIDLAREEGFKGCMSCATSFYNQNMLAEHFGMQTLCEKSYAEHFTEYQRIPENIRHIHKSGKIMARLL